MFWIGLVIGVALLALVLWIKGKGINFVWYDAVIGLIALILGLLAVQHYTSSSAGGESTSAWMGALIFGVLTVILALVEWQLLIRRSKA